MTAFTKADVVDLVWTQFLRACAEKQFEIIACCFMPDHVHLVVEGMADDADRIVRHRAGPSRLKPGVA